MLGGGDEPPSVRLTGAAGARAAELGKSVSVSLTHQRDPELTLEKVKQREREALLYRLD